MTRPATIASLLLCLSGCAAPYQQVALEVPEPAREMRAAWIATVHNIDWPSRPGLDARTQRAELRELAWSIVRAQPWRLRAYGNLARSLRRAARV